MTADEVNPARKYYPHYCNSIFYIFNVATAAKIVEAAKVTKLFVMAIPYLFRPKNISSLTTSL